MWENYDPFTDVSGDRHKYYRMEEIIHKEITSKGQ